MPIAKKSRLQSWASQSPSVLESRTERALRALAQFAGLDDPLNDVTNLINPLISIYSSKAARELGTKRFLESVKNFPSVYRPAAEAFAQKYPRIAAHIRFSRTPASDPWTIISRVPQYGRVTAPIEIRGGKEALKLAKKDPKMALEQLFHEGTHIAQALSLPDFGALYRYVQGVLGYSGNPFERTAYFRGWKAVDPGGVPVIGVHALARPKNALEALQESVPEARTVVPEFYSLISNRKISKP